MLLGGEPGCFHMSDNSGTLTRDEKVQNLLFNYSMILMATFEEAFANLASTMTDALAKTGAVMADVLTNSFGGSIEEEMDNGPSMKLDDLGPRASEKVKDAFADIRTQASADFSAQDDSIKRIMRDPATDEAVTIVEGFDFKLPRLTEKLSDDDMTRYMALLKSEDPQLMKMLKQLAVWQEKLPRLAADDR
jgi:hypothetical protein